MGEVIPRRILLRGFGPPASAIKVQHPSAGILLAVACIPFATATVSSHCHLDCRVCRIDPYRHPQGTSRREYIAAPDRDRDRGSSLLRGCPSKYPRTFPTTTLGYCLGGKHTIPRRHALLNLAFSLSSVPSRDPGKRFGILTLSFRSSDAHGDSLTTTSLRSPTRLSSDHDGANPAELDLVVCLPELQQLVLHLLRKLATVLSGSTPAAIRLCASALALGQSPGSRAILWGILTTAAVTARPSTTTTTTTTTAPIQPAPGGHARIFKSQGRPRRHGRDDAVPQGLQSRGRGGQAGASGVSGPRFGGRGIMILGRARGIARC